MIHVYIGTGKGKTSAALGLVLRAAGWNKRVYLAQFLKSDTLQSGEVMAIRQSLSKNIAVQRFKGQTHPFFLSGRKFKRDVLVDSLLAALQEVERAIRSKKYDIVVLDEVLDACVQKFIPEQSLLDVLGLNGHIEYVLTGRACPRRIRARADYISKITSLKHPFSKGIKARKGIEF